MSEPSSSLARECSPFLDGLIDRQPQWFCDLEKQGRLENAISPAFKDLQASIADHGLDTGLRQFRNREMIRIIWRELNRLATLEETMGDLSVLADLCLQAALTHHYESLIKRFGTPRDTGGNVQQLVVIGLGKLGGSELNLSSDIDIIFTFPEAGECDGRASLSNEQFFTRLAQWVVRSLSEVNEHGFCFRVDTRLRPFGESGPLVCSFGAMEQYYQREGRDWERYALIKARPVAGNLQAGAELLTVLRPFVYRRYIDFGAIEALHEMHRSLLEDSARHDRSNDIKRGPGGIREIEFLVQAFQLLRGGREASLQTNSILKAMFALEQLKILSSDTVNSLVENYRFLRRLENAIQALHDEQTHTVPSGDDLERVAHAMCFEHSGLLLDALKNTRGYVLGAIQDCFPEQPTSHENDVQKEQWAMIRAGAKHAVDSLQGPFNHFTNALSRLSLSSRAALRLDQFMPGLLARLDASSLTEVVVTDVLNLVLAICRRSAYLSLLVQNPSALDRMLDLFAASDWIARIVIRHPALLDELIDPNLGKLLPDKQEMQSTVNRILDTNQDAENAVLAFNHMKLSFGLRIAVAELESTLSVRQVQKILSHLAAVIIQGCYELALREASLKHGSLPGDGMAIIAYGSLGAEELSYNSDIDLIFLYQQEKVLSDGKRALEPERYHTGVVRRMLNFLTSSTASGRLYQVDTRLRPNGRSGLLVSSLSAFAKYQRNEAWVWELQALTRARPCAGSKTIGNEFKILREQVLSLNRDPDETRSQVRKMRERLREAHSTDHGFKHGMGGLIDIDFIAQMGVLCAGSTGLPAVNASGTLEQLEALQKLAWLKPDQFKIMSQSLSVLTQNRHFSLISREPPDGCSFDEACQEICRSYLQDS